MFNLNGIYATIASVVIFTTGGAYVTYKYQKNYYEAKISKIEADNAKAIAKQREADDSTISRLVETIKAERARTSSFERQIKQIGILGSGNANTCRVSFGFIRLFNASATGEISAPQDSDTTTSTIELDTVLSTILDNHGKYREAIRQVNAIIETQK